MEVFRITKEKHTTKISSSEAANRWNKKGEKVVYTASSRSLATLELIVHRKAITSHFTYKVMVISIDNSDHFHKQIKTSDLPENWRTLAAYPTLREIGSNWYQSLDSLILKIPSVIIPKEYNYIINTEHPDFKEAVKLIRNEDYFWDKRLL